MPVLGAVRAGGRRLGRMVLVLGASVGKLKVCIIEGEMGVLLLLVVDIAFVDDICRGSRAQA